MGCLNCSADATHRAPIQQGRIYAFRECDLSMMPTEQVHLVARAQSVARRIWTDDEVLYVELVSGSIVESEVAQAFPRALVELY